MSLVTILIFGAARGTALDCRVVMIKSDGVKRFLNYVVSSVEPFRASSKVSAFAWLRVWLNEQAIRTDVLSLLEGCLSRKPGVRAENCQTALDQVSMNLFVMIQDVRDARACEFVKLPSGDQQVIDMMIARVEQFHSRLLDKFNEIAWNRAMQKAEKESNQTEKGQP